MALRWLYPLLVLLTEAWSSRRDAQVRLLKLQVELLRAHIPGDRVILAPEEGNRLMKIGAELDHRAHDLLGIVAVKTYQRWRREATVGHQADRRRAEEGDHPLAVPVPSARRPKWGR